jgi:hypothetical protein
MKKLNKKAIGEANFEHIGKYILWIILTVIMGLAVYLIINNITTI